VQTVHRFKTLLPSLPSRLKVACFLVERLLWNQLANSGVQVVRETLEQSLVPLSRWIRVPLNSFVH
jgi:hypothetical protein